jgi:hypothetical protein
VLRCGGQPFVGGAAAAAGWRQGYFKSAKQLAGSTPLHHAAAVRTASDAALQLARALLRAGANVRAKDAAGKTPLGCAATAELRSLLSSPAAVAAQEANQTRVLAQCGALSEEEHEWLRCGNLLLGAHDKLAAIKAAFDDDLYSPAEYAAQRSVVIGDLIKQTTLAVADASAELAEHAAESEALCGAALTAWVARRATFRAAEALLVLLAKIAKKKATGGLEADVATRKATQAVAGVPASAVQLAQLCAWELFDDLKPATDASAAAAEAALEAAAADAAKQALEAHRREAAAASAAAKAAAAQRAAAAASRAAVESASAAEADMRETAARKRREADAAQAAAQRESDVAARAQMAEADRQAALARCKHKTQEATALAAAAADAEHKAAIVTAQLVRQQAENERMARELQAATAAAQAVASALAAKSRSLQPVLKRPPAGKKFALCIGAAAYPLAPLKNSVNDAKAMAAKLRELGYTVDTVLNPTLASLDGAITAFIRKLEPGAVSTFFFAGHGTHAPDGTNYLLPVDAAVGEVGRGGDKGGTALESSAIDMQDVLERMAKRKSALNVLIADACRTLPLARGERGMKVVGALAHMEAPANSVLAFACEMGKPAQDGADASAVNGVFTACLLRRIGEEVDVDTMLRRVAQDVVDATRGEQVPWRNNSVRDENVCIF